MTRTKGFVLIIVINLIILLLQCLILPRKNWLKNRLKVIHYLVTKLQKSVLALDYIYWDDPNELVDRLQLLTAERSAGNPSHVNEIHSIIEELREAGYIY